MPSDPSRRGAVEIETSPADGAGPPDGGDGRRRRSARRRYPSMVAAAYLLAAASSGGEGGGASPRAPALAGLAAWAAAAVALFFDLQGSDPGILTEDVVRRLDDAAEGGPGGDGCDGGDEEIGEGAEGSDAERRGLLLSGQPPLAPPEGAPPPTSDEKRPRPQPRRRFPKLHPSARRKFCERCAFRPPLRSHHCREVDACVATFDHHCPFLDTCVGERNHFRFWLFLLLNAASARAALGVVGGGGGAPPSGGVGSSSPPMRAFVDRAVPLLSKFCLGAIYAAALILLAMHTALALGNITTFEFTKGSEHVDYLRGTKMMDLPFGRGGALSNLWIFFRRDDIARRMLRRCRRVGHGRCEKSSNGPSTTADTSSATYEDGWLPIVWRMPEYIDRESEDWWNHPLQNKYWSCC